MKRPIPGGLLIAVEGIDGAGKTTVAATLAQWCGERGLLCALSKEPTSLEWGTKLRDSAATGRLTLAQELDMFHKDRAQHTEQSIAPALEEDGIMILDRYYWSTAAYQGARGANVKELIEFAEANFPIPDLVLLLNVSVEEGQKRLNSRGGPAGELDASTLQSCRESFRAIPAISQAKFASVDAMLPLGEVSAECLRIFKQTAQQKLWKSADPRLMTRETLAMFGN